MKVRCAVPYMYYLLFLAGVVVPPLLMVLAVFVDLRSRRGFGLLSVVLAMMGICLWRIVPSEQGLLHSSASEQALFQIALFFDFLICGYLTLLVWIGTVVEASMARQMRWLVALVAEVVLAVLIVPTALLLHLGAPLFTFLGGVEASLLLLVPMVTALAYGVVRSARPASRPELEIAPGELSSAAAGEAPQSPGEVPQSPGRTPPQPAASYQGSVIAVGILSTIVFLCMLVVIVLAVIGAIRTPWYTFPAGTSPDVTGLANLGMMLASMFLGVPASVIAIVLGHVTLVILRRIPHRSPRKAPGRVVLTVLLTAALVTGYLAVAMQIYYGVVFFTTNGYG
jgi:hypothetical protein